MAEPPNFRPPIPSGPPPTYARAVTKVYRSNLRPIVLFITAVSAVWALASGVSSIKDRGSNGETARLQTFDIIFAIFYFVGGAIEIFGFMSAVSQKIRLVRLYFYDSVFACILVTVAEIMGVVIHFVLKNDIISSCVTSYTGADLVNGFGDSVGTLSGQEAQDYCDRAWSRLTFWDFGWLIVAVVFGVLFACVAAAYYHQLLDPSSTRSSLPPSQQYRLNTFIPPNQPGYPNVPRRNSDYVPPYPGHGGAPPLYQGYEGDVGDDTKDREAFYDSSMGGASSPAVDEHGHAHGHGGLGAGYADGNGASDSTVTLEVPKGDGASAGAGAGGSAAR